MRSHRLLNPVNYSKMPTFYINKKDIISVRKNKKDLVLLKKRKYDSFNESILGLGDIEKESKQINALSVFFDLEGFTNFCKQSDPHLAVPEYLSEYLKWVFSEVRKTLINKNFKEGYDTWADLPFLVKYMGDGLLFLWDTENMHESEIRNVVVSMYDICQNYLSDFFPKISKSITSPPSKLRCGIARGTIYSVGNGDDFVGPCINMSARLQKLYSLSFCFSRRGLDLNEMGHFYKKIFDVKKVDIRGIGKEELVCIIKSEYNKLDILEKKKFKSI